MGRPREHDAATQDRLLAAAARVSAEEGWKAVTVRRVAERAGTTTRAVYARFGSKQGLEEALHLAMFERLRELMRDTPESPDPRADLLALAEVYRRWATERPERYAALIRFMGPRAAPRSPQGIALARSATRELRETIARCAEAGLLAAGDVDAFTIQWRAVAHGLAEFENHGLLEDGDEAWRSVLTAVLDGYAARAGEIAA
jgi:AcrR family transcriptional regulator